MSPYKTLNTGPISSTPEGWVVPTPIVAHVVLLLLQTQQSGNMF